MLPCLQHVWDAMRQPLTLPLQSHLQQPIGLDPTRAPCMAAGACMGFLRSSAKHQHMWRGYFQRTASSHGTGCFRASSQCRWATGLPASFIQGTGAALHHMPWSVTSCLVGAEWGMGVRVSRGKPRVFSAKGLLTDAGGCSLGLHSFSRFCLIFLDDDTWFD